MQKKRFSGTVYHGTNKTFDKFDQGRARVANDFYGGGVAYFTDSLPIARNYALAMVKKYGGQPILYEVRLDLKNVFDVDDQFEGDRLKELVPEKGLEPFARGAGLMRLGTDKYEVLFRLSSGDVKISGDRVFKGLSSGGVSSSKARDILVKNGYDGLRYNGGAQMGGARHDVYLAYKSTAIRITDRAAT